MYKKKTTETDINQRSLSLNNINIDSQTYAKYYEYAQNESKVFKRSRKYDHQKSEDEYDKLFNEEGFPLKPKFLKTSIDSQDKGKDI